MNLEDAKTALRRRAIVFEIGGFRPPDDPVASWFGSVNFAANGEQWPSTNGEPMHALCQINLTEMPFRPPRLNDVDLITVFIGSNELPNRSGNGTNWCLRAYPSLSELVPLPAQETGSHIKSFPMRPRIIDADYPNWEDVNVDLDEDVAETYYDHFENVGGLKLGGWPTLVQSEIFWAPWNKHPASPEYVFQIDTTEKGNWMWGDNGVGYFGRGTSRGHENEWACEWQCY
jgi:hypothetical protein